MDFDDFADNDNSKSYGGNADDWFLGQTTNQNLTKEEQEKLLQKDSVIFLIDCNESMSEKNNIHNPEQVSSADAVMKACFQFMKSKIIHSEQDKIGVILYGSSQTDNGINAPGVAVLQGLDVLDAQTIREFQTQMTKFNDDYCDKSMQSAVQGFDQGLARGLQICYGEFRQIADQNFSKHIYLFTDNDNPAERCEKLLTEVKQTVKDLEELEVQIELFQMPKAVREHDENGDLLPPTFNIRSFYAEVITFDADDLDQTGNLLISGIDGAQSRLFELMKRIKQREFKRRAQVKCVFNLAPNSQIALGFYSTVMQAKKPAAVRINQETGTQLRSTQIFTCEDTGKVLYRQQIGNFLPIGQEKVKLGPDEVNQVKNFDQVGMTLMGFKPASYLQVYHNVRHSTFVYPDEKRISGSSMCADALIHEMKRKDRIAIVRVKVRDNAQVRFCALLPQVPTEDQPFEPTGFSLIVLPYAEDMRELDSIMVAAGLNKNKEKQQLPIVQSLAKKEKDAAKLMIKNLTFDFSSSNFENPSIQKFYTGLQSLALKESASAPVKDLLEPDYQNMQQLKPVFDKFKGTFFGGENQDPETVVKKPVKGPRQNKAQASNGMGKEVVTHEILDFNEDDDVVMVQPTEQIYQQKDTENLTRKRKNTEQTKSGPKMVNNKRQKMTASAPMMNEQGISLENKIKEKVFDGTIDQLGARELKEFLTSKNLKVNNADKKQQIVQKVKDFFQSAQVIE